MGAISRLGAVSLNCADPHELAIFYSGLLEAEIAVDEDGFAAIKTDNIWISFQRVADFKPSTWPSPETPSIAHLDFSVANLDEGVAAAVAAGATLAETQPAPDMWRVLLDPAGNPFCVTTLIPD